MVYEWHCGGCGRGVVFPLNQVRFGYGYGKERTLGSIGERTREGLQGFRVLLESLPSGDRKLIVAYRQHVGNPDAAKPSDTWSGWSNSFAWRERAAAYDDYLANLRREAYERVIEEEAERQAREVEKARYRSNELLTLGYERAMESLEEMDASQMRMSDVIQVTRLYMDYIKAFEVHPESRHDDDWTEEDDATVERIFREIEAEKDSEESGEGSDEEDSESDGSGEDSSKDSEGDET